MPEVRVRGVQFRFLLLLWACNFLPAFLFQAHAYPPTYGGEIEFTNKEIDEAQYDFGGDTWRISDESADMQDRFHDEVLEKCEGCKIRLLWDHDGVATFRVTYPDGWWFQISMDPHVIEIQTAPATLKKLKQIRKRIQTDIFESAEKLGLKAGVWDSGGHIHIGLESAFGDDALLFRNFIVDFVNHSEMANGILLNDHANAPPVQSLDREQKLAFLQVIRDFDEGRRKTIHEIAEGLISQVYYRTLEETWAPPTKFHALNVTRVFENIIFERAKRTVEVRSLRGQKSADEFILMVQLFESRIAYLKKLKKPIDVTFGPPKSHKKDLLKNFYRYVIESGLNWADFLPLIPKRFQSIKPGTFEVPQAGKEISKTPKKKRKPSHVKKAPPTRSRSTASTYLKSALSQKRPCALRLTAFPH